MLNRKQPLSRLGRKRIGGLEGGKEPVSTFGPILSPRPAPLLFFNVNLVVNLESLFADYRRFYDVRIGAAVDGFVSCLLRAYLASCFLRCSAACSFLTDTPSSSGWYCAGSNFGLLVGATAWVSLRNVSIRASSSLTRAGFCSARLLFSPRSSFKLNKRYRCAAFSPP